MQPSFWEQDVMLDTDFIVVGAGLVGLQTALALRARQPHASIRVLERGALPSGASSRNAGFACFGSLTEFLHDVDTMGKDAAVELVDRRWRGLQRLRSSLGDTAIGYEGHGGFELLREADLPALERMAHANAWLEPVFGHAVFTLDEPARSRCGFGKQVRAIVRNALEGQLHSGLLMRALARLAMQHEIEMHTGVTVDALEEGDGGVRVHISTPSHMIFRAAHVAVCINGFTAGLLPDCGIVPARGQVLLTEPVPTLAWRGCYHMERGFYYFRNVGERVLLGGARHLFTEDETTTELALTGSVQGALENLLHDIILPGSTPRIAQRWSGIMGFTADKLPIVRRVSPRVAIGFGCNGMGVALSTDIAGRTAALLT